MKKKKEGGGSCICEQHGFSRDEAVLPWTTGALDVTQRFCSSVKELDTHIYQL